MNGNLLILIELSLVFLVAFGWGFNELRQLKKYEKKTPRQANDDSESN